MVAHALTPVGRQRQGDCSVQGQSTLQRVPGHPALLHRENCLEKTTNDKQTYKKASGTWFSLFTFSDRSLSTCEI